MTSVVRIQHDDRTKVLFCWWAINTSPVTLSGLNPYERGAPGHHWLTISTSTRRFAPLERPRQGQCPALRRDMIPLLSLHLARDWIREGSTGVKERAIEVRADFKPRSRMHHGNRAVVKSLLETDVRTISAGSSHGGTVAVLTCGGGDTGSGRTALGEMNLPASSAVARRFYLRTSVHTHRGGAAAVGATHRGGVPCPKKKKTRRERAPHGPTAPSIQTWDTAPPPPIHRPRLHD